MKENGFCVVIPCNDLDTSEIIKAEIYHSMGYYSKIVDASTGLVVR